MQKLAALFWFFLLLLGCQSPVSNPVVPTNYTYPLGNGVSLYAATADGNGLLVYANGASSWAQMNWSVFYNTSNYYNTPLKMINPPVNDVTVANGVVYAATDDGLLVGGGSSWTRYLTGTKVNGVTVFNGNVYASTNGTSSTGGLRTASVSSLSSFGQQAVPNGSSNQVVTQILPIDNTHCFAATPSGLFENTSTTSTQFTAFSSPTNNVYYPYAGTINSVTYANSIVYASTPLGVYTASTSPPNYLAATWISFVTAAYAGGAINSVFAAGANLFLATAATLVTSTNSGASWSQIFTSGYPVYNVAEGVDASTYYCSNGLGGVGVLSEANGQFSWDTSVLTGVNVVKVYVGP